MGSSDVKYPWPTTVNVANFVTVKPCLKENEVEGLSNFNIWKEQMLCLVESQDVLGFINGEILPPQQANTESSNIECEQKLWRRTDRLVKGWILGSIGKDALDAVWKLETAREVWLKLDEIFNDEDEDQKITPETGGDLGQYLPLYIAAQRGDWQTAAGEFFNEDRSAATAVISSDRESALHVAISTGKANNFVELFVNFVQPDALAQRDRYGNTALHRAAMVGNTKAARTLVDKNSGLLYIFNNMNRSPVLEAAVYGRKNTLEYLISMSELNVEHSPFEGQLGVELLIQVIGAEFFDIALGLVEKYPNLARRSANGVSALFAIACKSSAFPSGEHFSWWEEFIYHRIPLEQPKGKATQVTSFAGDIESNAPARKCSSSFQIISRVTQMLEFMLWKVIEHLVPQVKDIRDKKAVHQKTHELVKCLCKQMVSLPEHEASSMFSKSISRAAKYGISEIVKMIMEMYPMVNLHDRDTGRNVFHLAALNRFENVFNLIYNMSDRKYAFFNNMDNDGNNLMHMCGKLASYERLSLVTGAALQMQRELQWFKEMEKLVYPSSPNETFETPKKLATPAVESDPEKEKYVYSSCRTSLNKDKETPKMLFTKEHKQLKAEGDKWMKDTASACIIAASLIATVVFAAAFTLPGGFASQTGIPIFSDHSIFILFAISDAVSFFTSVTSLLVFLSLLISRYAEEDFLHVLPKRLSIGLLSLFISIIFMMTAFSAALYFVYRGRMARYIIPLATFASLPTTSFMLLQFPLLVDVIHSTYGPGIFGKKSNGVLY